MVARPLVDSVVGAAIMLSQEKTLTMPQLSYTIISAMLSSRSGQVSRAHRELSDRLVPWHKHAYITESFHWTREITPLMNTDMNAAKNAYNAP